MRSYNTKIFSEFFNKINYTLHLFPTYPNVITEQININKDSNNEDINKKRFSFINGIAVPSKLGINNKYNYYLNNNIHEFSENNSFGKCGSRVLCGLDIELNKINVKIFTTQFGMDVNERINSAKIIHDLFKNDNNNIILTGDFNSFPGKEHESDKQIEIIEQTFKRISKDITNQYNIPNNGTFIGMRPVEDEKYCINLENGQMVGWLDHIFIKNKMDNQTECLKCQIITPETDINNKEKCLYDRLYPYSDHCALWAVIQII